MHQPHHRQVAACSEFHKRGVVAKLPSRSAKPNERVLARSYEELAIWPALQEHWYPPAFRDFNARCRRPLCDGSDCVRK
jgi:hypothetical protein